MAGQTHLQPGSRWEVIKSRHAGHQREVVSFNGITVRVRNGRGFDRHQQGRVASIPAAVFVQEHQLVKAAKEAR